MTTREEWRVKPSDPDRLTKFMNDDNNSATIMPTIEHRKMKHLHLTRLSASESKRLSPREEEVLELLSSGLLYREVGEKLNIGWETVRSHVKRICSKMRVRNRIEAVVKYKTKSDQHAISSRGQEGINPK